jgi:hypothetical protein
MAAAAPFRVTAADALLLVMAAAVRRRAAEAADRRMVGDRTAADPTAVVAVADMGGNCALDCFPA